MSFKLLFLERAVRWLVGGDLLTFIIEAVQEVSDANTSGEDKRLAVQMMATEFFSKTSAVFINIAIELAVLMLKESLTKEA